MIDARVGTFQDSVMAEIISPAIARSKTQLYALEQVPVTVPFQQLRS